jgi:sec-independent protein translocase protein TatA
MMGATSWIHWVVVGVVILLLFGRGRFSGMMEDVAKGIKSFKKGMAEDDKPAAPKIETGAPLSPDLEKQADKTA